MTNIYFLLQCQYMNKRKGYGNISKGSLQEKLALIFNQILSISSLCLEIGLENFFVVIRTKNGTFLGVCLKVDFQCRVIFTCLRA